MSCKKHNLPAMFTIIVIRRCKTTQHECFACNWIIDAFVNNFRCLRLRGETNDPHPIIITNCN